MAYCRKGISLIKLRSRKMKELNILQMEEIIGGKTAQEWVGCVIGALTAAVGIWGMGAVLAGAAAGGPVGAIGAATLIIGPVGVAGAIIGCD
jgi:predicted phage tail protein